MIKIKTSLIGILSILMLFGMAMTAGAEEADNAAYWTDVTTGSPVTSLNAAVGQEQVVRLMAEVPAGKTLKAYSFMVFYEKDKVEISKVSAAPSAAVKPANISTDIEGEIVVNGFNIKGAKGEKDAEGNDQGITVALIDVTIKAASPETSYVTVLFSGFGASSTDEFKPEVEPLVVVGN